MKYQLIYLKYRECVDNVYFITKYYEKYKNCFSLGFIDRQIEPVLHKICHVYAKMMVLVDHDTLIDTDQLAHTLTYEDCEEIIENKLDFIEKVKDFLDHKSERIKKVIERTVSLNEKYFLSDLLYNVDLAQRLKDQMELMIKNSQYIHEDLKYSA